MTKNYFSENPQVVDNIRNIVKDVLGDKFYIEVDIHYSMDKRENLMIMAACSPFEINGIRYQRPQTVALSWWNWSDFSDELKSQAFNLSGGRNVKCSADANNPKEAHLARMNINVGVSIPFRKASGQQNVDKAVRKFFENYIKVLKENKSRLLYKDIVDYSALGI